MFVDLGQYIEILGYFSLSLCDTFDRLVKMIERRRAVFSIDLMNKWNDFINRIAGDKTSREFFEESKACGEILETLVAGQPNQRGSGDLYFNLQRHGQ